jgi:hypothetical protein
MHATQARLLAEFHFREGVVALCPTPLLYVVHVLAGNLKVALVDTVSA